MPEFHDAVVTLLDAFAHGISTIKTQKTRRPKNSSSSSPSPERLLSKSLKKNRNKVRTAYEQDFERFGSKFAVGDEAARVNLAGILTRLTTGFLSVFNRFLRGKSTATDYQTLLSLSDVSRRETIRTFDMLSERLSASSLELATAKEKDYSKKKRKKGHTTTSKSSSASRAIAASKGGRKRSKGKDKAVSALASAGWVRAKPKHTSSRKLSKRTTTIPLHLLEAPSAPQQDPAILAPPCTPPPRYDYDPNPLSQYQVYQIPQMRSQIRMSPDTKFPQPSLSNHPAFRSQQPQPSSDSKGPPLDLKRSLARKELNRKSYMSFQSDSTKLGEIPESRWSRPPVGREGRKEFEVQAYFPLGGNTSPKPAKQSRLKRFFGRS
ncbi:hypothetical protein HYALB_00009653 [Hymenoscyphus albidus]|uniref:Uncharacterized protein n=1 Tax=Hymenoscyphus albidus TaxID=595503 RepID=A0A9N9LJP3_9HELO|nr:hypothetical protein HYALB_00009653 [Hymenoscyphus albidus]